MANGVQTPIGCSRPSSSQMSSGRRNGRRSSVTSAGATCSTKSPCGRTALNSREWRGTEIDTTGDGFLATFDGPARAIRCACAARDAVRDSRARDRAGLPHRRVRDLWIHNLVGLTVHTGARVAALAGPSEVLVSKSPSRISWPVRGSSSTIAGEHELKGVPGTWRIYAVR